MKFGIYYAYWEKQWGGDFIPYISRVKKLGFDILEVACHDFLHQPESYFPRLREIAESEGIILTGGYGPDARHDISSADPAVVEAAFDVYRDMFRKMELAGIDRLGGGLYSYWPVDYSVPFDKEAAWERSVANIRKLGDIAADYGIMLGMEVLNRFEGYLLNTAEECVRFVDEVGKDNVRVMLDTFHMNIEEDSFRDAILTAGKRLGHLHVGEANRRPPFEGGRIPWAEIAAALKEVEYDGYVVMEPFVRMGGQIGQDIRIWHDLSGGCPDEKLDSDAAASVAFLRGLMNG